MKVRYAIWALLVVGIIYLVNNNPSKGEYTSWASETLVKNSDIHKSLKETEQNDPDGIAGELASIGKQFAEKYVQPQVGLLLDKYTIEQDYVLFSKYTTTVQLGSGTYTYITIGIANRFFPIEQPEPKSEKSV